jgi:hypothetical protein
MKVSAKTLDLFCKMDDAWRELFDSLYNDLADPNKTGYDAAALAIASDLAPRPKLFPTANYDQEADNA